MTLLPSGWIAEARQVVSPNCNERPQRGVDLLVVHNISLPPYQYGGDDVEKLFTNCLDPSGHPFYESLRELRVSAHFFVRRDGELVQFVPVGRRAWHAGVSSWRGRDGCNDFSVGVEMEGCDFEPFSDAQYRTLIALARCLMRDQPLAGMTGHEDIAPNRKTDPGPWFDWERVRRAVGLPG
ncbi:1,6-anhydro-N-acetylmuramyl-L-alanine amidase AmpD [Paludibacterium paludis]|uniref:1,6-anhydro-N-acetylmuramyl-L-alanine amidase AmpD n=1 Tax=Paludibacterium paludis TaxID=1225769 RepID=UPI00227D8519|nr:1,6-anhydro-N-acetylmuramyl-L-alanine amidase AmpD [Paludibacterium paludis]